MCRTIADEGKNLFVKEKCVALDILADVASQALQQEEEKVKEKEKEKEAAQKWKIYGVSDSFKIVIKRVKKVSWIIHKFSISTQPPFLFLLLFLLLVGELEKPHQPIYPVQHTFPSQIDFSPHQLLSCTYRFCPC